MIKFSVFWRQIPANRHPFCRELRQDFDFHISLYGSFWSEWCLLANKIKFQMNMLCSILFLDSKIHNKSENQENIFEITLT